MPLTGTLAPCPQIIIDVATGKIVPDLSKYSQRTAKTAKETAKGPSTPYAEVTLDQIARATAYVRQCDPAVAGQHGHDQTFKVACKLIKGFALSREDALRLLRDEYNPRCVPPWIDKDLEHKIDEALKQPGANGHMLNDAREAVKRYTPAEPPLPSPPRQPDPAIYYGLIGQLVRLIEPHSETDPIALLVQALVVFGNIIGRTAHFGIEGDTHFLNLFVVLVGPSSKSRKGSSWGHVYKFFKSLVPDWAANVVKSGLSSGEGLIWAIRDAIWKTEAVTKKGVKEYVEVKVDAGVTDKRLLCYESEFASVLKVMDRQGNTLSALLRQAWDGASVLQSLTKNSPAKTTNPHISTVCHITADELRRYLSATEQANGFGNRFLWISASRSKLLPEGGKVDENALAGLRESFLKAIAFAQSQGAIGFDDQGREAWHTAYTKLTDRKPGLVGTMLARSDPQVRRLACLYALLDLSPVVRKEHLEAALALWKYVEDTVQYVFGDSLGDTTADEILLALQGTPEGLTRHHIRRVVFQGHKSSAAINRALALLHGYKLAHSKKVETGGRPEVRWYAGPEPVCGERS